jgi:hypothetical protein
VKLNAQALGCLRQHQGQLAAPHHANAATHACCP